MRGCFVVLEGIDGCGKTTQMQHLENWLPSSGLMPKGSRLYLTREPGGTELGVALRKLLLDPPADLSPVPLTELLLYAADRAQHVSKVILPHLEQGDWVLSDRFSGSTLAYQGYGRKLDIKLIEKLEMIATTGLVPDLTIFLNISASVSLSRRGSGFADRIESEGLNFMSNVAAGFLELARKRSWAVIDASQKIDNVSKTIENAMLRHFRII